MQSIYLVPNKILIGLCFMLTVGLLGFSNKVQAQSLKEFSPDQAQYLNELEKLVTASNRKEIKAIMDEFRTHVEAGRLSEDQFVQLHRLSNKMLELRMRANPYFSRFIQTINVMIQTGMFKTQFDTWLTVVEDYTNQLRRSKLKNFVNYMDFSIDLMERRALRLTTKSGLQWLVSSYDYQFKLDDDKIYVEFPKEMEIIGKRKSDSIVINKTTGVYYPIRNLWKGNKGQVDWSRVGLGSDVYCTFNDYSIDMKSNNYKIDTVTLYHPTFFDSPIKGKFDDKVVVNAQKTNSYPRFASFNTNLSIKNIGNKIKYVGGFEMQGNSVIGFGGEITRARMQFYKESNELAITTYANRYVIRKGEYIVANDVAASVYFGQDSIYHPNARLKFYIDKRLLELTREGTGNTGALFFNSYHNIEMDVEKVGWAIDSDSIEIGRYLIRSAGGRPKLAAFESVNYFDAEKYMNYQNISNYNPIARIKAIAEEDNTREIDAQELATRLNPRFSVQTITPLLLKLVEDGFIYYDKENKLVIVNEKIFNYSDASRQKIDYDVITAISASRQANNAVINLDNIELDINGVDQVVLSDSQLVGFKPSNLQLKVRKDREMEFEGRLFAGYGIFHGKDFDFNYNEFKIYANQVDSFILRIPDPNRELDRTGKPHLIPLGTRIEDMKCEVIIDEPDNKSSRTNNQHYPAIESNEPCYVYYDAKRTQNGAYDRDSFFFQVKPFVFDSLDSFDPKDLKFDGKLVSSEIFPAFDETLKVRGDLSLGFRTTTPPEGYPIYRGKGIYKGVISMNNEGLLGEGTVSYLAANVNSEDIVFLPGQLTASADSFNLEEFKGDAYEFPRLRGEEVSVDWRPYKDSMYVQTKEKPFEVFNSDFSLTGLAILTPGGLYGDGILDWKDAALTSTNLRFSIAGVTADSSDLRIKNIGRGGFAFRTSNVKADIDFDEQVGKFESNSISISTEMPYNQYKTSMDEFKWDMEERVIDFKTKNGQAEFLSIHPKQDSLRFTGTSANYNLTESVLRIEGVSFIQSADAYIYPSGEQVVIQPKADMDLLENATIIADTVNRYHTINKANVKVLGKENYKATGGFYEYNVDTIVQEIKFDRIDIVRTRKGPKRGKLTTVGEGRVAMSDNFYLDKKIFFQGTARLKADRKELEFDGFAKFLSPVVGDSSWFSIDNDIDRKDVVLQYDKPKNLIGDRVYTGIYIKRDTGLIYPRILTPKYSRRDRPIFETQGFIKYLADGDRFLMGDSLKVLANGKRGNLIVLDRLTGRLDFEGKYTLASELPYVKVDAAGTGSVSGIADEDVQIKMDMMLGIDFVIPDKLINYLIRDLDVNSFDLAFATYDKNHVRKGLAEFITDDKKLEKIYKEIEDYDRVTWPKGYDDYTFLFGNVSMNWNPTRYSMVSKKGISLSYINGYALHKKVEAYVEVRMSRSRDEFNIYIKSPSGNFYYFNYQNRVLSVVSSNPDFNDAVLGMKKKEMQFKMKDGEFYEIKPTGVNAAKFFLQRIRD